MGCISADAGLDFCNARTKFAMRNTKTALRQKNQSISCPNSEIRAMKFWILWTDLSLVGLQLGIL